MSGKKTTTETVTTTTTTTTKRLSSLATKDDAQLTSAEEAVLRMHHGISVNPDAQLATNGVNDDLMAQLREMELKAFEATGRIDDLDDVPTDDNSKTASIVDKLKSKS